MNENTKKIGEFREKIQILKMQPVIDNSGGYSENWTVQQQVWAYIRMLETPENNNTTRLEHLANYEFFCRYINVLPEQRVLFRGMQAVIKNITEMDNLKQFISFSARIIIN